MSFKIIIEEVSAKQAIEELLHAADFYRANPALSSGAVEAPATTTEGAAAVVATKQGRVRPSRIAPPAGQRPAAGPDAAPPDGVDPAAAAPAAEPVAPAEAPAPAPAPAVLPEPTITLVQARSFLSPHLADATKSPKIVAVIKKYSATGRLSDVAEGDLAKLLDDVKTELGVVQ